MLHTACTSTSSHCGTPPASKKSLSNMTGMRKRPLGFPLLLPEDTKSRRRPASKSLLLETRSGASGAFDAVDLSLPRLLQLPRFLLPRAGGAPSVGPGASLPRLLPLLLSFPLEPDRMPLRIDSTLPGAHLLDSGSGPSCTLRSLSLLGFEGLLRSGLLSRTSWLTAAIAGKCFRGVIQCLLGVPLGCCARGRGAPAGWS